MKNIKFIDFWVWLIMALGIITMLMGAASCSPQRNLANIEFKHPGLLAHYCTTNYPIVVGIPKIETRIDTVTETIYANCDSVAAAILKENPTISNDSLMKLLKDYKTTIKYYNTNTITSTPYFDSALKYYYLYQIDSSNKVANKATIEAASAKKGSSIWMWATIIVGSILIIIVVIIVLIVSRNLKPKL